VPHVTSFPGTGSYNGLVIRGRAGNSPEHPRGKKLKKGEPCAMNAAKKVFESLKENYMEYVAMCYGPFDR
jgi:hypothetical protein